MAENIQKPVTLIRTNSPTEMKTTVTSLQLALRITIEAIGGAKVVAPALWGLAGKKDIAHIRLLHCTSFQREDEGYREKLYPSEIVQIVQMGAQHGCFAVLEYLAEVCGRELK